MQELISQIHDIPISVVIEKYGIALKKSGVNLKACCPFHTEKTPSFVVNPVKNRCWCFGCNKGGDAISFVQLLRGYPRPWDAIVDLSHEFNLQLPEAHEPSDEETDLRRRQEQIAVVYEAAHEFYRGCLQQPENKPALDYLLTRTSSELIDKFELGCAPSGWTGLFDFLKGKGFKTEALLLSGLVVEKNGKLFDFFRGQIIFPITSKSGTVVAFSGRMVPGLHGQNSTMPKYVNSPESVLYKKSQTLFGLSHALKAIAKKDGLYVCEGFFDVLRLWQFGIENVAASCGTAVTEEQLKLISRHNKNLILLFDGDAAGLKALERTGELAILQKMNCNVLPLHADGDKTDPDSFFTSAEHFRQFKTENLQDFIVWKTRQKAQFIHNFPDRKAAAITEISQLILKYEQASRREMYLEECAKLIPSRKLWTKEIATLTKSVDKPGNRVLNIPEGVTMADVSRWGFYEEGNCYWFVRGETVIQGSNFIMRPLFHIPSVLNAKRLYEIVNEHGFGLVIELLQKDLISLQAFKLRVESLGNFIWKAGETELTKLKTFLYEKTDSCIEITQLGWQKHGFFAWSNGIYNGEFTPIDSHGIVEHKGRKFYLPAMSDIYSGEDTLYMSERRFIHHSKCNISLYEYASKLIEVFGNNAKIAVCFYLATLYRDIIVKQFNFFPILNLFGPKGAGKTELAVSIMALFGRQPKGPNINNTSKAALADHVGQVSNACQHIDEYKNGIDFEKIEFLKGLWDGTGRTRMNMDKDRKKETTMVDCGVILSGQEMPLADVALFSRLIYLTFHQVEFTDHQRHEFDSLKNIEKKGITHISNECLSHREYMLNNYSSAYDKTCGMLTESLRGEVIEDRIFKNWAVVIAAFICLQDRISLPFSANDLISHAADQLIVQQRETRSGNEVSAFWNIVQFLYASDEIQEEVDFAIKVLTKLKTQNKDYEWEYPKRVIFIQHSRILPLYQRYGKQNNEKVLPKESIDYYLRNDKRYFGKKMSHSFRNINPKTKQLDDQRPWKITTAYVFDYDSINKDMSITLHADKHPDDENVLFKNNIEEEPEKTDLPF